MAVKIPASQLYRYRTFAVRSFERRNRSSGTGIRGQRCGGRKSIRTDRGTRNRYSCYDGIGSNGRLWGAADTNKKTGSSPNDIYFLDVGRYSE